MQPYTLPAFVVSDTRRRRQSELTYYRAEVHLREGGLDYDVVGWSLEAIINDVLDQYQRHLSFLDCVR